MSKKQTIQFLPELQQIDAIIQQNSNFLSSEILCTVKCDQLDFPIYALYLGTQNHNAPCIAFVGGIHGLERIGTQVVLSFLETLLERLKWDRVFEDILNRVRILFLPLMNPVGMARRTRSNGNGVDLMRNAPIESNEPTIWLGGGHRVSPHLPWYRGMAGEPMETEARTLCDYVLKELLSSPFSLVLDCHSGFGYRDRIWFPYARSRIESIHHIGEVYYLRNLFQKTYPYQNYCFEPQSQHYLTHGDLWDYLYQKSLNQSNIFLPLTLEMGSWRWIRKNPMQIFNQLGLFHPIKPHRVNRVLRGHLILMEFLLHATLSYEKWVRESQSLNMANQARSLWYNENG